MMIFMMKKLKIIKFMQKTVQINTEQKQLGLSGVAALFLMFVVMPGTSLAASPSSAVSNAEIEAEQVVIPQVYRRDVEAPKIDAQDFDVSLFMGFLSIEDFGSSPVGGVKLSYNVTEDLFMQAAFAVSEVSDTSYRRFGLNVFPEETTSLSYYTLSVGYHLFPGELFKGENFAMPGSVYVKGGVGSTSFADEDHFTVSLGLGMRLLLSKSFSLGVEMQDHIFENDILGENKLTNNLELSIAAGFYF